MIIEKVTLMNARTFILSIVAALCALNAGAQSSDAVLRDKITSAVMKVYDEELTKNPNDYNTLFARAHQHFYNGEYVSALADVNQAILLTPKSDKELRFDEHILRARISDARMDYAGALSDLLMAQELEPKSLACTDLIAKTNLKAGNLNAAEKAFKAILRAESMNYDAMYGLAQVELARGNNQAAIEQVDKAVGLFHAEPQVYVNRADIYSRQGNVEAAVNNLLRGMTVGDGGVAAQRLFELSDVHYDEVMRSLAALADASSDAGTYRYLRANIAMDHLHFGQALSDFNYIQRNNLYGSHGMYNNMAKCYLELGRFDDALNYANQALSMTSSEPEYYLVKALATFYAGDGNNHDDAMQVLEECSAIAPQYVPMLMTKAALLVAKGQENEALGYLNAAVANEPDNAQALMTRGLLLKKLDLANLAVKDFNTMILLSDESFDLKGLALSELGRDNEALKWLNDITRVQLPGGENFYYAAVLMAMRGDNFKAMEYVQKALDNGFGSVYQLKYDVLSLVGLSSLRSDPDFDLLIEKAQQNFSF